MLNLCSDNTSEVHPKIMEALANANQFATMAYGNDDFTRHLKNQVKDIFEYQDLEIWPVATGSAANAIALSNHTEPFCATICHRLAHIEVDECGAPEFYSGGAKLIHSDHNMDAKVTKQGLQQVINRGWQGVVHNMQPRMLSLTQITEMGTHYDLYEIKELCDMAHHHNLYVHMDGARFANALDILNCSPADMTWKSGIDLLSLGATKNGAMAAEMIISFTPSGHEKLNFMRKRGGHLFSKMRYLSAQLSAYLQDDLYLKNAQHSNKMAQKLKSGLIKAGYSVIGNPLGNLFFVYFPKNLVQNLRSNGYSFYDYPAFDENCYRMVTSWNHDEKLIDNLLMLIQNFRS